MDESRFAPENEDLLDHFDPDGTITVTEFRGRIRKRKYGTLIASAVMTALGVYYTLTYENQFESIAQVIGMILGGFGLALLPAFIFALPFAAISYRTFAYARKYWNMYWWISLGWTLFCMLAYILNMVYAPGSSD